MNVDQLTAAIKNLSDDDLQVLVSSLSGDFGDNTASTMETMEFLFNHSKYHVRNWKEAYNVCLRKLAVICGKDSK